MKNLIIMTTVVVSIYYIFTSYSPFQTEVTDPHFVEIRVSLKGTNIKMVGFGKMFSHGDCIGRSAIFWREVFKDSGEINISETEVSCKKRISARYKKLFDDKTTTASYVALNRGNRFERDARFVMYGIPSSVVMKECEKIISEVKKNYQGKIFCVKGTIG